MSHFFRNLFWDFFKKSFRDLFRNDFVFFFGKLFQKFLQKFFHWFLFSMDASNNFPRNYLKDSLKNIYDGIFQKKKNLAWIASEFLQWLFPEIHPGFFFWEFVQWLLFRCFSSELSLEKPTEISSGILLFLFSNISLKFLRKFLSELLEKFRQGFH